MNNKWSNIFLGSILLFNSTGSVASLLLSSDLIGYSALSGAALNIAADSVISDHLGGVGAIGIGARTDTSNIYSDAAVATGDSSNVGSVYSGAAAGIAASGSAENVYAKQASVIGAIANVGNVYSGAAITLGAGSSSQEVYAAAAITGAGASSFNAFTDTSAEVNLYQQTLDMADALDQISNAQEALSALDSDFELDAIVGGPLPTLFTAGIYEGAAVSVVADSIIQLDGEGAENPFWIFNLSAALTVGARSTFEIINAGAGASVIWNLGGALGLGEGSSFIGTSFIKGAATGATSNISCGNLYATAAIGIGSLISTNCIGSEENGWAGSVNGLVAGLDITNGIASNRSLSALSVPEPSTAFMLSAVLLLFLPLKFKRK
ncbi:MAG: hypothetical protein ACJA13_002077 [Paraglaciecola sp.]|jgi:hypothetical protein